MTEETLEKLLETADIHAQRMRETLNRIKLFQPITPKFVEQLSDDQTILFDSYILRFTKLQDLLGAKIFGKALEFAEEPTSGLTVIDKLNALEKYGVIDNKDAWSKLREIRNTLAHEYPDHPEVTAKALNEALEQGEFLLTCLEKLKRFIQDVAAKKK
jgi:hypothetical protein